MEDNSKFFDLEDSNKSPDKQEEPSSIRPFSGKEVKKYPHYFLKVLGKNKEGDYKVRFLTSPIKQWVGKSMRFKEYDLEYIIDKDINWRKDDSMSNYDKDEKGIYGYVPMLISHCKDSIVLIKERDKNSSKNE